MTDRIKNLLKILKEEEYKKQRTEFGYDVSDELKENSALTKSVLLFEKNIKVESSYFHDGERIGFNRINSKLFYVRDYHFDGNITPDYETALNTGLDDIKEKIENKLKKDNPKNREFLENSLFTLNIALDYADKCKENAKKEGKTEIYDSLCRVPHKRAETFLDACIFVKFIIFTLRCNSSNHIGLGCFDRYMYPFYLKDKENGKTDEEILEIIEEFFISINLDADLYFGVQKGDNGQSMMLGGKFADGSSAFTDLSRLCMTASLELNLIDPKINLRVDKDTPDEVYEFATLLTKQGMGFPQYCNDDVVIPGLISLGYSKEDAYNYTVAACWEFIIPGKGADIPNVAAVNFPNIVRETMVQNLENCKDFEELLSFVKIAIENCCDKLINKTFHFYREAAPYMSVYVGDCIEREMDFSSGGAVYNNLGFHGVGIAPAADALAAVKEAVFDKKFCSAEKILSAMENNFEGEEMLRKQLLACPKMGNNDDRADTLGNFIMEIFSSYLNGKPNGFGGIYRAGTGSAMEYYSSSKDVGATADGRKKGEPYGCSFSPAITCNCEGPLSCIQSFTKFDLTKIINGGPLTLEIHDTVFSNNQGIKKVAQLVKAFIHFGGHQLQLNSVNRDRLLDAEAHPENHKNLIVRVWGWSGHFTELDKPYRDHIIKRTEFKV